MRKQRQHLVGFRPHGLELTVCLFLIVATLVVYWQVRNHDFVNYDDDQYVTENRHVRAGLTWKGVIWAFTTNHASNWHPLTWLSHMLDCELYGLNPGRHHLTSLILHVVNTLLLFLVLERITGGLWQSAFVAALFALHPLHVESVAWVAERKDVLSTFFWMLTMWAYVRYVECPRYSRYLLALFFFALGLMAKPMLVTLPFVLFLMDYWPLGRFRLRGSNAVISRSHNSYSQKSLLQVVKEKSPFFALAVVSSVVTLLAQQQGGAIRSLEVFPLEIRIANAVVSYVSYIGKMTWPYKLAVLYPLSRTFPMWQALGCGVLLVCISVLVIRAKHRAPYLPVGWLWYLGTLVPVIGLVQVGVQSMADRYTYIPLIGLFIIIAWGFPNLLQRWRHRRIVLLILAGTLLLALMMRTGLQVRYWKNTIALWRHTLDVTAGNCVGHTNLGLALAQQGRLDEAISHYSKALQINPGYAHTHINLGAALAQQGRLDEAISHYSEALRIQPDYVKAHTNLGLALAQQGNLDEAISHFSEVLRIKPDDVEALNNLGVALERQGNLDEAISHYSEALRIQPGHAKTHNNLGVALALKGSLNEAVSHYSAALRIQPDYAEVHNNLGLALARQGSLKKAIGCFSEALRIKPDYAEARHNLEACLRVMDKSPGASNTVERAW